MATDLVTWTTKIILLSLEVFENRSYCIAYSIILIGSGFISMFGSLIGLLNTTEMSDRIPAIGSLSAQMNSILTYLAILAYRKNLLELIHELETKDENGAKIPDRSEIIIKNNLTWFFLTVVLTCSLYVVPPLFATIFEEGLDEKLSILIPYWFSCGAGSVERFCWDIHNSTKPMVQGLNLYLATSLNAYIFVYLLSFTMYGLVVGELEMRMEIVRGKVRRFNELAERSESNAVDVEEQLYRKFVQIMEYEKFIYRCTVETIHTWKLYLSHYYASSYMDMTIFIFSMIVLGLNQRLFIFRILGLGIPRLLLALIIAHYSQNISHLDEEFLDIVSKIKWYDRKAKFRKVYLQVLTFHQRSNLIKIVGVVELDLNCYTRLVKNIYSLSNFLYLRYGQ